MVGRKDKEILTLIAEDKEYGFKMLVEKYQVQVINLAYSLSRDSSLAEDIAQEVFLKIFKKIDSFQRKSSLSTWIYRITLNMSYQFLRKRKFSLFSPKKYSFSPEDTQEKKEIINIGLSRLPLKYRIVIILKDLQGLSYKEIARILNCSMGTVESRLFRARILLKKILTPLIKEGL
ncbi:MAG TPA: sigma-70 family RNA polymerase sigma factor [Candidatus Omnitrophica bacterium]|nr:MAG: RNA polymerase subunit sigma-70 [Candidatus Omnitrophota bacterium]RKY34450.1 MAG: RNA polymerase subunit sigma-70 [Candidatus Omnitrophota bacterium]HEC69543.1 sigma-70 family RNA polymerase sigma factor [Candidatus Omnitrophota bacterium]